jgi:hypothetical protein
MTRKRKLEKLAKAAAEFYATPDLRLRSQPEDSATTKARHVCQWMAMDAGISPSVLGRFWRMDRTAIYYAFKIVSNRIKNSTAEKRELKEFMAFARDKYFLAKPD